MNKGLIGALAVVLIAATGWYWSQARTGEDTASSAQPGTTARSAGAPMAEVVVPTEFSAQARQGETYFNAVCASCHGADAAGQDGVAPPLVHRIYEPSHHGDMAFVLAARRGVQAHHWSFGNMPPVDQPLTDSELDAIITYVRELQRANGIS
ncbi:c-type cytochrome [uncultured Paracoccus sp.]|uniref:c-type cytochrome n=1 Tax=uncultured Paracoccus sp. TaxID=189685 RepID=UPI002638F050|nr:c-type cytochrome [uncultured Paracoccus sp.]